LSFTSITVTGTYQDPAGNALAGTVKFMLSTTLRDGQTGPFVTPVPITATLSDGALSQALVANDDTTTVPNGSTYQVVETIAGISRQPYNITVPHGAEDATIDLAALAP
jgi:hypothetical protein